MTEAQKLEIMEVFESARQLRDAQARFVTITCVDLLDDETALHLRVSELRRQIALLDSKLFSVFGLLHKFRCQNHYNATPNIDPPHTFTVDDL